MSFGWQRCSSPWVRSGSRTLCWVVSRCGGERPSADFLFARGGSGGLAPAARPMSRVERKDDLSRFIRALAFAAHRHRAQRRKDAAASPYINHPIALVDVLVNEGGVTDAVVLCAAVLHDTIEDTETTADEIAQAFGERVASIVVEVSDDKSLPKDVRKAMQIEHAPTLSTEAKLVKLADKICNLRDVLAAPPAGWPTERKRGYFAWAEKVVGGLRGSNARLEAAFDELLERRGELD